METALWVLGYFLLIVSASMIGAGLWLKYGGKK